MLGIMVLIGIIPLLIFNIINSYMWTATTKSYFGADNVLLYYGGMIGACLSGFITLIGLGYTLRENRKNLEKQKETLDYEYQRQLEMKKLEELKDIQKEAIFNLYELKTQINKFCDVIQLGASIDKKNKRVEKSVAVQQMRLCTYKAEFFHEKLCLGDLTLGFENIDNEMKVLISKMYLDSDDTRANTHKVINEYIKNLKELYRN